MPTRRSTFLMMAFGALLCVSAFAAWEVFKNAREAQARAASLHERDIRAHDALTALRASVYLTAILARDFLLDPDPAYANEHVEQFRSVQQQAKDSFEILNEAAQDEAQRATLTLIWMELEAYADTTRVMLAWSPEEKQVQRAAMLRQRLRHHEEIFAMAERIGQLSSQNLSQERAKMAAAEKDFRSSLGWIAIVSLLLGLGISAVTVTRMRTLEHQSRAAESELRLLSRGLRTAQERERKSLSRELHDQVGQLPTGLRIELAAVSRLHGAPESEVATRLARAKGVVEQTLAIVRNIAMLLRPSMLDDLGLTPALNWLVKEVSRSSNVAVRVDLDARADYLPDAHRTCLYRVVQEALTNIARHSGARTVDVHVKTMEHWVRASVTDDGKGFESRA